jgi:hypothetical protein
MMKPGRMLLILLLVCASVPASFLYASPAFPVAVMTGVACSIAGYIMFRYYHADLVLFLVVQPCMFLAWFVSPILSFSLEMIFIVGLLASIGLLSRWGDLIPPAIFLIGMATIAFLLSTTRHTTIPVLLFIPAAALVWLGILGLAYRTTARAGGGMP